MEGNWERGAGGREAPMHIILRTPKNGVNQFLFHSPHGILPTRRNRNELVDHCGAKASGWLQVKGNK